MIGKPHLNGCGLSYRSYRCLPIPQDAISKPALFSLVYQLIINTMSEKTIYPGAPINNVGYSQNPRMNQQFTPEQNEGTNFPGVNNNPAVEPVNKKPILGFLYSVSKDYAGEYWPLYLGANTIGRGSDCTVTLKETTVSKHHATIVIRQMQNQGADAGLFVFIQDVVSMCGTLVNGVTLDFNPKECKNGDIITIGENYELYFILVEPKVLGLAPKENFKPVAAQSKPAPEPAPANVFAGNINKGTLSGDGSTSLEGRMATIYRSQK